MSDYPLTSSGGATSSGEGAPSTTDTAKEQARSVAADAKEQTRSVAADAKGQAADVASHAAEETKQVVDEAKNQFRDLLWQSRSELRQQANGQQQRLAQGLRAIGEELGEMASSSSSQGLAGQAASQLSSRANQAADFLEQRDVTGVLDEVSDYARRRPGVFLLGAALVGVVAGRVTRGLQAGSSSSESTSESQTYIAGGNATGVPQVSGPGTTYITSDRAEYGTGAGGQPGSGYGTGTEGPLDTGYGTGREGPLGSGYGTASEVTPPPATDPLTNPPREGEGRGQ